MIKTLWKTTAIVIAFATTSLGTSALGDGFWWDLFNHESDCVQLTATQEYLFMSRDARLDTGGNVVNGPDAGLLGFSNSDFSHETGYRLSLGIQTPENRIEAIFSQYGTWFSSDTGSLTAGVAFDGGIPGSWPAGSNSLAANTFFAPMFVAATAELDEAEGLGPNNAFADTLPTYSRTYESQMQDLQINWMNNDPTADVRVGIGFRNVQLDEMASMMISGTFRAADIAAPNGGLSNATLTGTAGLTFHSNTPNGIDDESILGNNGPSDQLALSYAAQTSNDLNGFQAVVDACLVDNGRFELKLIGRAGAYHNHASGRVQEQYRAIGSDASDYRRSFTDSKDSVAFVGGVGAQGAVRLSDHIRLFAGYQGTFITGVALSPEQGAGIRGGIYEVETDGNVIVHGGNAGLEITY